MLFANVENELDSVEWVGNLNFQREPTEIISERVGLKGKITQLYQLSFTNSFVYS